MEADGKVPNLETRAIHKALVVHDGPRSEESLAMF
jgi:hypothetical protein